MFATNAPNALTPIHARRSINSGRTAVHRTESRDGSDIPFSCLSSRRLRPTSGGAILFNKKIMIMLVMAGACSAGAQTTLANLGEVMDKGAVKVDKAQWIAMLPTANIGMGQTRRETTTTKIVYQRDGRLEGQLFGNHDTLAIWGSWKIEDDGKLCVEQSYPSNGSYKGCFYMFMNGNEIYHVDAGYGLRKTEPESDRSATVIVRTIEK